MIVATSSFGAKEQHTDTTPIVDVHLSTTGCSMFLLSSHDFVNSSLSLASQLAEPSTQETNHVFLDSLPFSLNHLMATRGVSNHSTSCLKDTEINSNLSQCLRGAHIMYRAA